MYIVYMVAMKRGELKIEILRVLKEKGPMTSAQIAAELGIGEREVIGAMRVLSHESKVVVMKRNRKQANTWALPNWWAGEMKEERR